VTKGWRQLRNEELMVCTPHQILLGWHVKKHEIWRGHTTRTGETKHNSTHSILLGGGGLGMAAPCLRRLVTGF
jgi:hypothetical protein